MIKILLAILTVFIIFLLNKFRIEIATSGKLFDKPDKIRKFHKEETPLLGGLMIFLPFLLTSFFYIFFQNFEKSFLIILIASSCCFIVGLIDDAKSLAYKYKFIFLIIIFYFFCFLEPNLQINKIFFSSINKTYSLGSFGIHFTVLCLLLLTNALNLIDGIDGLCIMISLIIINWLMFFFNAFEITNFILSISLIYIFFLNLKKNIFLGDSGSILMGSLIGLNLIYNYNQQITQNIIPVENIFIALMLPGIDMLRVFALRIYNKKNPFVGDRIHLHHLLLDNKFNNMSILLIFLIASSTPILINMLFKINSLLIIVPFLFLYLFFIIYLKKNLTKIN